MIAVEGSVVVVVVAAADVWSPGHMGTRHALGVIGGAAGTDTEGVEVAGGNEGLGERRKESRPRLS